MAIDLLATVRHAVRDVDETTLRPVARRDSGLACSPRALLALLLYCYVRGVYGSAAIERLMLKDATFRAVCHDEFPSAQMLRCFRRQNRTIVLNCLCKVLQRTVETVPGQRVPESWDAEQCAEEASHRLDMAACLDSLEIET